MPDKKARRKGSSSGSPSFDAIIAAATRNIRTTRRGLRKARMSGWRQATAASERSTEQALRELGLSARFLRRGNVRASHAIGRLVREAEAAPKKVRKAQGRATQTYGGIYSGEAGRQFISARAQAKAGIAGARPYRGSAKRMGALGKLLMAGTRAGIKEAEAASQYQLNQALTARTKQDVAQVAAMRQDLLMSKLQHAQALEMAELQHEQALEEARKQARLSYQNDLRLLRAQGEKEGGGGSPAIQAAEIAETVPGISAAVREILEDDPDLSPEEVLKRLQEDNAIPILTEGISPMATRVYRSLITNIMNQGIYGKEPSATRADEIRANLDAIESVLSQYYPKLFSDPKLVKRLRRTIASGLMAAYPRKVEDDFDLWQEMKPVVTTTAFRQI
jgi:hypothetical protein